MNLPTGVTKSVDHDYSLAAAEKAAIVLALQLHPGATVLQMAKILGVSRAHIYRLARKYDLPQMLGRRTRLYKGVKTKTAQNGYQKKTVTIRADSSKAA